MQEFQALVDHFHHAVEISSLADLKAVSNRSVEAVSSDGFIHLRVKLVHLDNLTTHLRQYDERIKKLESELESLQASLHVAATYLLSRGKCSRYRSPRWWRNGWWRESSPTLTLIL